MPAPGYSRGGSRTSDDQMWYVFSGGMPLKATDE